MTPRQMDIIQEICDQLEPLKSNVRLGTADARPFVEIVIAQRLDLTPRISSGLMAITSAAEIRSAAKKFRAKFHKDKLAKLLKETQCIIGEAQPFPDIFKALDEQLERLEKIKGPDTRFDTSIFLTATVAHKLILDFSQLAPTGTEGGPLRSIASLIHEYRTGECDHDLKRACYMVLNDAFAFSITVY
jgi:hypothetical protein